jgi:hypothetical protein
MARPSFMGDCGYCQPQTAAWQATEIALVRNSEKAAKFLVTYQEYTENFP